jgi:hypothetical protein
MGIKLIKIELKVKISLSNNHGKEKSAPLLSVVRAKM